MRACTCADSSCRKCKCAKIKIHTPSGLAVVVCTSGAQPSMCTPWTKRLSTPSRAERHTFVSARPPTRSFQLQSRHPSRHRPSFLLRSNGWCSLKVGKKGVCEPKLGICTLAVVRVPALVPVPVPVPVRCVCACGCALWVLAGGSQLLMVVAGNECRHVCWPDVSLRVSWTRTSVAFFVSGPARLLSVRPCFFFRRRRACLFCLPAAAAAAGDCQLLEHIHGTAEVAVGASHDILTVRSYHHPVRICGAATKPSLTFL